MRRSRHNATNYAITEASGSLSDGTLYANGTIVSYTSDANLKVELYVNGSDKPQSDTTVSVKKGEETPVELSCKASSYDSFKLVITNKDDMPEDNEIVSYNLKSEESYIFRNNGHPVT